MKSSTTLLWKCATIAKSEAVAFKDKQLSPNLWCHFALQEHATIVKCEWAAGYIYIYIYIYDLLFIPECITQPSNTPGRRGGAAPAPN